MTCAFCEIVKGTRHAQVLYRTPSFVAFEPVTRAEHKLLIVPTGHYQSLGEIPLSVLSEWLSVAHEIAGRLKASSCKMQINVGAKHQNVRHLYMQFTYTKG